MQMYGYEVTKVHDNTWRIGDCPQGSEFLIKGSKRGLLIDTGFGIGGLREVVEELMEGLPYDVVDTHGHFDHVAANHQFEEVWIGKDDEELMMQVYKTKEGKEEYLKELGIYIKDGFSDKKYEDSFMNAYEGSFKIKYLSDGQIFDLGDTQVEAIHCIGHTKGGYCLLDKANRRLFVGDCVLRHVSVLHIGGMSVKDLIAGFEKLLSRKDEFDVMIGAHGHRQHGYRPLGVEYLYKLIKCAKEIDVTKSSVLHEVDGDGYEYYADGLTYGDYESVSVAYREECLDPDYQNPMYK